MNTITIKQLMELKEAWEKQKNSASENVSYYMGAIDAASMLISHLTPAIAEKKEPKDVERNSAVSKSEDSEEE